MFNLVRVVFSFKPPTTKAKLLSQMSLAIKKNMQTTYANNSYVQLIFRSVILLFAFSASTNFSSLFSPMLSASWHMSLAYKNDCLRFVQEKSSIPLRSSTSCSNDLAFNVSAMLFIISWLTLLSAK